jgi:hypothetical protein
MPTEYIQDKEIANAVTDMLGDTEFTEFAPLRDSEVKIESCVCVRTNQEGEDQPPKADPVSLKKVSPVEKVFVDLDYILVVDNSAWKTANTDQAQSAIIHRGLMKIQVEQSEKGLKLATRKPDIVEFSETVVRFGTYNQPLKTLKEAFTLAAKRLAKELHS